MIPMHEASIRFPSWLKTCTSARTDQHFCAAIRQSDSVSMACERRMVFSKSRDSMTSASVGRLGSKAGDAMGESSVVMMKRPSNGRSTNGFVTSAVTWTRTL